MQDVRRSVLLVAVALGLLVLQSVFSPWLAPNHWSPVLVIPFVIGLALSPDVTPVQGAATAFVLGYLQDLFTGNPLGAHTFVMVAVFLVAFGIAARLSFRGAAFQLVLTFVLTMGAGALLYALRRMFGPGHLSLLWPEWFLGVVGSSVATSVVALPIFVLVERLRSSPRRRGEEVKA